MKMPIVHSMMRHSYQNFIWAIFSFFICFPAALVLLYNHEIFTTVIDYRDPASLYLLCFGVITVIVFAIFIHLLLLSCFELYTNGLNSNECANRLWKHLKGHGFLCIFVCLDIAGYLMWLYLNLGLKFDWTYLLVIISASILFAFLVMWADYDDVDLTSSQNMEKSTGACWAYGAYVAFYKKILIDIPTRMSEFEEKHGITFLVKKLVIICPLSCNANGSLAGKDGNMTVFGQLEEIIDDEGANNNRILKTNVYKIRGLHEWYIAAEIPSPLATLYEMRDVMDKAIFQYHRECFIETLRDLLKSYQCIILEYDDLNSPEPLHSFLLSKLENKKFVSVIK